MRAGIPAPVLGLTIGLFIGLFSCSSEPTRTREDIQRVGFGGRAPTEGTIAFYDPRSGRSSKIGRSRMPALIIITTQKITGTSEDQHIKVDVGTIQGTDGKGRPTAKGDLRNIFQHSPRPRVVSQARFAELWSALEGVNVLKLPRHGGGIPPEDRPSIRMSAEGKTWIFLRPTDVPPGSLPKSREELEVMRNAWINGKILIVNSITMG